MDTIIAKYDVVNSTADLVYCQDLAYQKDMNQSIEYGTEYFENYVKRADTDISCKINQARINLSEKYCDKCILDIGIGSGEFIRRSTMKVYGYDINPHGVAWLKERHLFVNPYEEMHKDVQGVSLWDTLEHIKNPQELFAKIPTGTFMFVSLPTFNDLTTLTSSKHYKPNEHYYYFTIPGFIRFITDSGFNCVEHNDDETKAGREGITSFACLKV